MILKKITLKLEYTSEDGYVWWVEGVIRNKQGYMESTGDGGTDSLTEAIKDVRRLAKR